jgi:hypothetical protein
MPSLIIENLLVPNYQVPYYNIYPLHLEMRGCISKCFLSRWRFSRGEARFSS